MYSKKLKLDGQLYRQRDQLLQQFDKERESEGAANESNLQEQHEDNEIEDKNTDTQDDAAEETYYEEIYLDDDDCPSDTGSICNEDYEEEYLEDEEEEEDSSDVDPHTAKLKKSLRYWFIRNKISRRAGNELLSILRNDASLNLPQDVRTILKPPRSVGKLIVAVPGGGSLWYQGVQSCFQHYYRDVTPSVSEFQLNLSVDGIPLYNRSPTQMWPILMQLHGMVGVPVMVIGIFCGTSKSLDVESFLRPLYQN
uniref:Uncharacterized protein n=1 Tax=Anopheles dirus TaxID=7168 RepID=A0A182NE24_9DIPT